MKRALVLLLVACVAMAMATAMATATSPAQALGREEAARRVLRLSTGKPQVGLYSLMRFVDTTGAFMQKFSPLLKHDKMTTEEFVRQQFGNHQLGSASELDILGMMHAAGAAEKLALLLESTVTLEDMVLFDALLLNVNSSSSLLTEKGANWLETEYLPKFNTRRASLTEHHDAVERTIGAFELAVWSMRALGDARPFRDGNARLAEVMNALLLTPAVGLPFPTRVRAISYVTLTPVELGQEHQDPVTDAMAYVSTYSSVLDDASAVRDQAGVWHPARSSRWYVVTRYVAARLQDVKLLLQQQQGSYPLYIRQRLERLACPASGSVVCVVLASQAAKAIF